ncbi:hypothetical protein MBLNU13_g09452t1 [Cladosporium sp. NU13]
MKYTFPIVVSLACVAVRALPIPDDRSTNDAGVNDLFGEANNSFGSVGTDVTKLLGSLADQIGAILKRGLLDDVSQAISKRVDLLAGLTSGEDVKAVLELAGDDADGDRSSPLISELDGGDINDLVNNASNMLLARSRDGEAEDCSDPSDAEDNTGEPNNSCDAVTLGAVDVGVIADMVPRSLQDVSESGHISPVESSGDTVNNADDTGSGGFDDSSLVDDSSLTANDIENGVSAEGGDQTDLSKRTIAASTGGFITGIGNAVIASEVTVDDSVGLINGVAFA